MHRKFERGDCRNNTRNPSWVWSTLERKMKILERRQRWVSARRSCVGRETWRNWLGTSARLLQCKSAEMRAWNHWTWFGWTQTSLWIRHARKFNRSCAQENAKRRGKVRFNELYQLLDCSLHCHLSKRWRCLSQSWCLWVCRKKENHWSWDITTSAEDISKEQPKDSFTSDYPQSIVRSVAKTKVGRLIKSTYGTQDASHICQLDYVNFICGEWWVFRRGKHSAALAVVCQMTMDLHTSTVFFNSNTQRKTWEHLDSKIQIWKACCSWIVYSELELFGHWNCFETWSTHHQWVRMQFEERWSNTIQICLHETFVLGPRLIRSGWNNETFGPENERASRIWLYFVETCSTVSGGKAQSSAEISKTITCWKDHSLRGRLCWRPSPKEVHDGIGGSSR